MYLLWSLERWSVQTAIAKTTVAKWGNSEAIRIPRHLLDIAGLHRGDEVTIEFISHGQLGVRRVAKSAHRHVVPAAQITFDDLFRDYRGPRLENGDTWADADAQETETERRAWSL